MFFAAKEAVERKARASDELMRGEGIVRCSEQTRLQILSELKRHGVELPPDAKEELANGSPLQTRRVG